MCVCVFLLLLPLRVCLNEGWLDLCFSGVLVAAEVKKRRRARTNQGTCHILLEAAQGSNNLKPSALPPAKALISHSTDTAAPVQTAEQEQDSN